ncbi:hypothetical protein KIN20_035412 [Parelaphostrongylus tenuis]|uniref:Uncharacterized protein n=1 Tax=Parelaphostrongylus tenuis TaxID=148309 RepID=A0AAD5RB35_PARTN|nr:hypothetical protein KIN20_035412 [Parelaphostrongylus tenuis]
MNKIKVIQKPIDINPNISNFRLQKEALANSTAIEDFSDLAGHNEAMGDQAIFQLDSHQTDASNEEDYKNSFLKNEDNSAFHDGSGMVSPEDDFVRHDGSGITSSESTSDEHSDIEQWKDDIASENSHLAVIERPERNLLMASTKASTAQTGTLHFFSFARL